MTRKVLAAVHIFCGFRSCVFFFLFFFFSSLSLSRSSSSSDGDLRARRQPPRSISGHSDQQQPNRHHSERKSLAQVLKAIADFPRRVALVVGEWVWGEVTTWGKKKVSGQCVDIEDCRPLKSDQKERGVTRRYRLTEKATVSQP